MQKIIVLEYREIERQRGGNPAGLPSLVLALAPTPQDHEEEIAAYLERAPNYGAMGKVVNDALDERNGVILYPANNTDGVYLWPVELAYYVRTYHVRLPEHFIEHMRSRDWAPPAQIDYDALERALVAQGG